MIAIFFLAAIAAGAVAVPVEHKVITDWSNWTHVSNRIERVHTHVETALHYVIDEARRGNAKIGADIEAYLELKIPEALGVFSKVYAEIKAQTLTFEKTVDYFGPVEDLLFKIADELTPYFTLLPETNARNIVERLHEAQDEVMMLSINAS